MLEAVVSAGYATLLAVGYPALFTVFVLKGAIIGKPLPTSVFLPGYVLAVSPSWRTVLASVLVASLGYTIGQLLVYLLAARVGVDGVRSLPGVRLSDEQVERSNRLFRRYGGIGIVVTNLVPYVGSFALIPAGLTSYPFGRAAVYAFLSTLLNYALVIWFVTGTVGLVVGT